MKAHAYLLTTLIMSHIGRNMAGARNNTTTKMKPRSTGSSVVVRFLMEASTSDRNTEPPCQASVKVAGILANGYHLHDKRRKVSCSGHWSPEWFYPPLRQPRLILSRRQAPYSQRRGMRCQATGVSEDRSCKASRAHGRTLTGRTSGVWAEDWKPELEAVPSKPA